MIAALHVVLASSLAMAYAPAPPAPSPASSPGATPAGVQPAPGPRAEAPSPGVTVPPKFEHVRLDVTKSSTDRIAAAVKARLPHVTIGEAPVALGTRGVYVGVMPLPSGATRVLVVLSNGRYFSRTIQPAGSDPDAEIATAVAELLVSIESGQVVPDDPGAASASTGEIDAVTGQPVPPGKLPYSGWRLGFGLAPEIALGVWPSGVGGVFTGGGGSLEFRARAPKGVLLLAGARLMGNSGAGVKLVRGRAHVIAGYAWRPKRMEIDLGGGGTFEMWWTRIGGQRAEAMRSDQRGNPPLVGALVRLAVARLFAVGRADVRVGGRLEVAGSAAPDQGIRVPGVVRLGPVSPVDAFRLGGVEVMLGLDFAATWPIRQRVVRSGVTL